MKRILSAILLFSWCFASDFSFDPSIDKFNVLYEYCDPKFPTKKGINFGDNNDDDDKQIMCKKYLDEAIEFYQNRCDDNDIKSCANLSLIYSVGNGNYFFPKKDIEKVYGYDKKLCELGNDKGCDGVGSYFFGKSGKENKKIAKRYFKKACDLGYNMGCFSYKNYF